MRRRWRRGKRASMRSACPPERQHGERGRGVAAPGGGLARHFWRCSALTHACARRFLRSPQVPAAQLRARRRVAEPLNCARDCCFVHKLLISPRPLTSHTHAHACGFATLFACADDNNKTVWWFGVCLRRRRARRVARRLYAASRRGHRRGAARLGGRLFAAAAHRRAVHQRRPRCGATPSAALWRSTPSAAQTCGYEARAGGGGGARSSQHQ
jgi:hypothetical protein